MRRAKQVLLVFVLALVTASGLEASLLGRRKAAAPPAATAVVSGVSLTAIESDGSRVILRTSSTPAYTSYSPSPNVFVIDLASTAKGSAVSAPAALPAGVESVTAEEATEMGTHLTRVTFRMAQPATLQAAAVENSVVVTVPQSAVPAPLVAAVPVVPETVPAESHAETPRVERIADAPAAPVAEPAAVSEPLTLQKAKNLRAIGATGSGQDVEVRIAADGAITYKSFRLENPPRLVIDLPGVSNHAATPAVVVANAVVHRVRAGQFKSAPDPVARVVVELDGKPAYRISEEGDHLRIVFGSGASVAAVQPAAVKKVEAAPAPPELKPAPVKSAEAAPARAESKAVSSDVKKPAPATSAVNVFAPPPSGAQPVQVAEEKKPAASEPVKVASTDLVAQVPAVADEARWKMVSGTKKGSAKAVINADAAGQTAPSTQRTTTITPTSTPSIMTGAAAAAAASAPASENVFFEPQVSPAGTTNSRVLSTYPTGPGGRTLTPGERVYTGEPMSLNLSGADLRDVLRLFSQLTGLNIAIDPQVNGTVTVNFTDVPWDQALDIILRQNNLQYVLEGNVMRIGTIERLATEAEAQKKLEDQRRLNVPTVTVIFKLSYARATDVSTLLRALGSPRAQFIVDARTNQLIVTEIPQYLPTLRNVIDTVDVPTRQVMIEARIVEATKTFQQQYGFTFGFNGALDPALGTGPGLTFPNRIGFTGGPFNFGPGNPVLQLHLSDVLGTFNLDLALNASESEGLVKVISAPRVTTQDNQAADIQSGLRIPYPTTSCNGGNCLQTTTFVDATLSFTVTPQITEAGTVILDIAVQKNTPAATSTVSNAPPSITTRSAHTRLLIRDGGTAVIGGIYQVTDLKAQDRLPFVHEIPVIGNLFKTHSTNLTHDELLIFITTRIVKGS